MTPDPSIKRFEELDAGRVLGDLDAAEAAEWETLARSLRTGGDESLDRIAAEIEAAGAPKLTLPPELAARLKTAIPKQAAPPAGNPRGGSILTGPWLGWAAAACLAVLLVIDATKRDAPPPVTAEQPVPSSLENAPDVRKLPFTAASAAYGAVKGEVVWSDLRQEGYMRLSNIPANDPAKHQYQLWIVDPVRDEYPVDGGVFDIPAGPDPVVIPIDAKLAVKNPAAFVITLEQPGGVVRSKQENVVALAKF